MKVIDWARKIKVNRLGIKVAVYYAKSSVKTPILTCDLSDLTAKDTNSVVVNSTKRLTVSSFWYEEGEYKVEVK